MQTLSVMAAFVHFIKMIVEYKEIKEQLAWNFLAASEVVVGLSMLICVYFFVALFRWRRSEEDTFETRLKLVSLCNRALVLIAIGAQVHAAREAGIYLVAASNVKKFNKIQDEIEVEYPKPMVSQVFIRWNLGAAAAVLVVAWWRHSCLLFAKEKIGAK